MNLLGIDVGTTSLKAAAFSEDGELLTSVNIDYTLKTTGERIEFQADEYVRICIEAVKSITDKVHIDAMAIDTQGETLILTDENGVPVRDAIVWLDNRAVSEAAEIEAKFGRETVYNITGQPEITAGWPACKLMWVKANEPEVWSKTRKIFMLADYLNYKLTGNFHADRTLQSSTIYFDVNTGKWWDEMLNYIGITDEMLPVLHESGELIGDYNGIKVVTGALDQIAGAVGAGIVSNDTISEMTGTTLAICALSGEMPKFRADSIIPCHYHAVKGKYCLILWSPTAGMALKWFRNILCENYSFKELDGLAKDIPAGAEGLMMLPYLCGSTMPSYNPEAKGVFYGMTLNHTRGHFVRSILEAVAYNLKSNLDYIGFKGSEIRAMGGGALSPLWCQIKSDMTGLNLSTLKINETACLGSAILAGCGTGVYSSINEACDKIVKTNKTFIPEKVDYSEICKAYAELERRIFPK